MIEACLRLACRHLCHHFTFVNHFIPVVSYCPPAKSLRFTLGSPHNTAPKVKVIEKYLSKSLFSRALVCKFHENELSYKYF